MTPPGIIWESWTDRETRLAREAVARAVALRAKNLKRKKKK